MSLRKEYVRDGDRKIIGSITSGFSGSTSDIVRDDPQWDHRAHQRAFQDHPRCARQSGFDQLT